MKRDGCRSIPWKIILSARKMLEEDKAISNVYLPIYAKNLVYQVSSLNRIFCVDLNKRSCGCKKWELTKFPYKYAITVIYASKHNPEMYISYYYKKEAYLKEYELMIYPVSNEE